MNELRSIPNTADSDPNFLLRAKGRERAKRKLRSMAIAAEKAGFINPSGLRSDLLINGEELKLRSIKPEQIRKILDEEYEEEEEGKDGRDGSSKPKRRHDDGSTDPLQSVIAALGATEGSGESSGHNRTVTKLVYLPRMDRLLVLEMRNPVITALSFTGAPAAKMRGTKGYPTAAVFFEVQQVSAHICTVMVFPSANIMNHCGGVGCGPLQGTSWNPYLITSSTDNRIHLWDLSVGSAQFTLITSWPTPSCVTSLCWCQKYNTLFSGSEDGAIHAWDVSTQLERRCMLGHTEFVTEMLLLSDLDVLISSSLDGSICIWDMTRGALREVSGCC